MPGWSRAGADGRGRRRDRGAAGPGARTRGARRRRAPRPARPRSTRRTTTSCCSISGFPTSTASRSAGGCGPRSEVPIIVVTARGDEVDRVVGLELGADDYIVKPFGFRELLARIRAVTRRTQSRPDERHAAAPSGRSTSTGGRIRSTLAGRGRRRSRRRSSTCSRCSPRRRAPSSPARTSSRRSGTRTGTGRRRRSTSTSRRVRKKLGDPAWIETVRGVGFRLVDPAGS